MDKLIRKLEEKTKKDLEIKKQVKEMSERLGKEGKQKRRTTIISD